MTTQIGNVQKLKTIICERKWDQLLEHVKPKHFVRQESEDLPDADILAQICRVLVNETVPDEVKILCLKCLGNSCLDSYKHKQHTLGDKESDKYGMILYDGLSNGEHGKNCDYPHNSHFPYNGVAEWTFDYITAREESTHCLTDNELDIFRLSIQFLCNLFTYACGNVTAGGNDDILKYLNCDSLKQTVINNIQSNHKPLTNAACIFVHNALKEFGESYFTDDEKNYLCTQLLKPIKEGFTSALSTLLYILHCPNMFEVVYNGMTTDNKSDLLQIIYDELWESARQTMLDDLNSLLANDAVEFLVSTFCEKSDLILKTVDHYLNNVDPREVILILNILGLVTSMPNYKISKNIRCLVINCKYLLMSLRLMGKESDNYFTPITNLSKVAPNAQRRTISVNSATNSTDAALEADCDPQNHPAYGFKAGLIKVIGNIVYRNKMCQDLNIAVLLLNVPGVDKEYSLLILRLIHVPSRCAT